MEANELTEATVERLWKLSSGHPFLAEMCERWMDDRNRAEAGRSIAIYIKGSKLEAALTTTSQETT